MTENEARKTLEIFDRERKEYMTSMPSTPYFDRVKADDFTQSLNIAIKSLEEIQQYRAIGTVEECREARERQRAKKPRFYAHNYYCGNCGNLVGNDEFKWRQYMYCDKCGHSVLWERDDE